MRRTKVILIALTALLLATAAGARDTASRFPIANVLENPEYATRLEGVKFYFGSQKHPTVVREMAEYQSNKKTNAFGKSDHEACNWAFLSALLSLRERTLAEGGNAVIGIYGYYKKRDFHSDTEYQCGAGNVMVGVTLKGTVATLEE